MDEAELIQRQRDREKRLRDAILKDEFGEASSVLDDANFGGVVADKVGFLRAGALAEWTRPLVGNQPLNPASPDWQGIKDGVTRNYFKKPNAAGVTDQQFHELVKADIQTRDSALEKARNDALAGVGLVTGLSAFSQGAAQSPVKGKFFTYQGEYQKAYSQVSQRVEPYRDTINEASRILSSELDREVADVEAFRKVADMLIAVPEKDRPIVLNAIGVTGGLATGDTKAYSEKLFASFDRMLGSLAAGGESLFESVATSVGLTEAAAGLAPADAEAAFQTEARRREYDILKNMVRQTAYGEVSPVQGDGWLEETGIGLAAMAPLTVATFVPYAGQAAMVGYFRDDTAANLMRDNPGMTAAQADSIATVAAPFMAAVETVANKIPFGKVPAVEQFFRSQVTSLKTAATRFGARTALGTGAEIAEEGVQQMLPVAFQELATALSSDIPGVDWEREVERLKEMPAQVFGPALVMSMIGAGGVSIAEVRNGRALAQNVDLLVANGNSPEQAQRIVEAGQKQDWAQVDAIIRDGFSKPQATPEQRQAAIQSFTSKIDKTQAAVKSLEVNGQIASIRRAADGWALIGIDGTQTAKFQSFEEADGARWADAKQRNLNLHAAMREYITQMDSRLGENQENIIRFNPEKLSVETAVERGMVTKEAIDTRVAAMRALDEGRIEEKEYSAASAEAEIEGDNEPVLTILGTNYLEFKDGVSRGVIDLYQGATLHDLVEEMAEVSVKRLGVRKNKAKLIADLRDAEAKIQEVERRMGDEPSLLFRSANDAELTDADVIEAFSHVAKSYFTNEALRSDTAKGWQAKNKNTRRYLTQLRKGVTESGAFRWIQALGRKLGSIFQRASAIDAVRGQFKGDLETLIRQAVGLDSQDTFDQQTLEEAQTLAREAGVGGEVSMSLTKGDLQTRLAAMFDPFQRDPVMRRKIGLAAAQRVQKVAREALFSVSGSGVNKNTMERLEKERLKALSKLKANAPEWVKKRLQTPTTPEQVRAEVQKDRLLGWLRTLNAAVSSLPLEVRSRILQGGTMKIASLKSNEARLRAVEEIIKKADRHLEAYLREEITAEIDKLTERYKSTRKDAGQMAGKLISTATEQVDYLAAFRDLDEKQQQDTIAALEKTIEEDDNADNVQDALNKLGIAELFFNEQKQSAEQLNNSLEWLQSTIELGRQGKKMLDEERKQFIGSLKTAALDSVLAGDEASLIAAENKDANVSATTLKKSVDLLKGIFYEVIPTTLQQLEMTFGEDSAIANHFRDRIIDATNQATDIKRKIERDRVQAMAEIFGTKSGIAQVIAMKRLQKVRKSGVMVNEGRKTEDVRLNADILQRLSDGAVQAADLGLTEAQVADALDEFAANPRTRGVMVEKVTNAGKMVELEMSEAQGIQYLFSWNQPDVQERMRRQGWDEATIAQLNEFLSPEAKALAAWMSEQYAQGADLIDPVYRRLFNAPMPRNKNYAPTFYNVSGSANVTPLDAGQQNSGISAGFTKARRAHNAPLKRVDSLVAFLSHWEHVSHWVAFSELVRDMKAVLADNTVQAAIATKISRPAADKLKTRIKSIESQGNNQAWALFAMDGFFARLNQARAFKGLAYRISPIIKQTSAILNPLLADVPAPAYFMRLGKLLTGNLDVSAMWRSDAINRRIDSGFSPEFRMAQQGAGVNGSVAVALMQRGMLPMSYTDAGWNTLGAAIAFDYYRSQAIKSMGDNVNMEAAEAAATKAVDRMLAVAAQPSELVNRALVEGSPNPFTKAVWMFASESRKTLAIELAAINRLLKGKSKNKAMDAQRILVAHFLMGAVTQLMSGFYSFLLGDEEDREREWSSEQWAAALLSGPINGLFVLGDVMGMLVRRAVGAEVWQASGSALMKAANDFWRGAANIDDLFSDDPEEIKAEIDRLSGAMGTITAGLVGPQAMALDVVLGNPLRDIEKARKRVTEEE